MSNEETVVFENGLKENFKEFKENFSTQFTDFNFVSPFFAYDIHDPDMAYAFYNEHDLKVFLERVWHDDNYSELDDIENSMDNWVITRFVPERFVKQYDSIYGDTKKTSITHKDKAVYRKQYKLSIEPCIYISLH